MALILGHYNGAQKEHALVDEETGNRVASVKIFVDDAIEEFLEVGDRLFPSEWYARVEWVKED